MRKLGIIAIVLMTLVIGVFSILKWLHMGPFATDNKDAGEAAMEEKPGYTDMDMLIVPVFSEDKVAVNFYVQLKLETLGPKNQAAVRKILPRLQSAFLRELYDYIPRTLKMKNKLDFVGIKNRMKMVSDKEAGPGIVSNILIQSVVDKAE